MPNSIKYNTSSESLALKKGNFWIGTGDVGKGPTSTTGFYNGITPPSGGYTIYLNKASGGPSIYTVTSDAQLITLTNQIAGASYTTVNQCFNYFAGQSDKMVVQRDYEGIVTNGLVLNLDAGYLPSYPQNGTSWYDLGPSSNTGTLTNGPTFSSTNGGSLVFDGIDDYAEVTQRNTNLEFQPTSGYSCMVFYKSTATSTTNGALIANMINQDSYQGWDIWFNGAISNTIAMHLIASWGANAIKVAVDYNYSTYSNQWLCFGYTYDGSCPTTTQGTLDSVNFYLNGQLYTSGKRLGQPQAGFGDGFNTSSETITYNTSQRFRVANRWLAGSTAAVPVTIGTVLVYNRKLSSSEMLQNYNAQKSRFGL
jgi:hypothetical protein